MEPECANPLLLKWTKEWLDVAIERGSKGASIYKKAYTSIKACPLPFNHPSEALQLKGLGPKLCDRLTEKLKAHCAENGLPMPDPPHKAQKRPSGENLPNALPNKKPRKPRAYVPALRSGPYALIIALSSLREDSNDSLPKSQLIELAQPYCDSSFVAPPDPTKFYTAWNSHKTLLEKDLMYSVGRPLKKYALTEDGWEVAKRIKKSIVREVGTSEGVDKAATLQTAQKPTSSHGRSRAVHTADLDSDEDKENRTIAQPAHTNLSKQPSQEFGSLKQISTSQLEAELRSRQAAAITSQSYSRSTEPDFLELLSSSPGPQQADSRQNVMREVNQDVQASNIPAPSTKPDQILPQSHLPSFEPIRISPGTFTVELILDNREVRAKTDRDYIQTELSKRDVQPLMRSLELGDALWIAKCKDPNLLARLGEEGDEIVLDWIVERKRLDDLIGSIRDGRFHEQKFRLRKSGVRNVVYVIEEISMNEETLKTYRQAMESAIASTQVVNGYFVKKTQKLDDTIRYLARMTKMLKSVYEPNPLLLIPSHTLSPSTYLPLLSSLPTPHNITFAAFSSLASKSSSLTLRDVFLKMLMCTRGVTGDKALEIQKRWETPRAFVEAFEALGKEGEGVGGERRGQGKGKGEGKKDLVWGALGGLVGKGKVGRELSGKIAEVWAEGKKDRIG